jgi:hypothetical protein
MGEKNCFRLEPLLGTAKYTGYSAVCFQANTVPAVYTSPSGLLFVTAVFKLEYAKTSCGVYEIERKIYIS